MKKIKLICCNCNKKYEKPWYRSPEHRSKYHKKIYKNYCSIQCKLIGYNQQVTTSCKWCGEIITKGKNEIKKSLSGNIFCSRSCSASFNNTQKRKSRRSKCEKKLFDLLIESLPYVEFIPNDKKLLDGYEIDIAIPDLKLGIEWNGIVHYKPIYGLEKLKKIQQNDAIKQKLAIEKEIELITIPDLVSNDKYIKEVFFKIKEIITNKIQNKNL